MSKMLVLTRVSKMDHVVFIAMAMGGLERSQDPRGDAEGTTAALGLGLGTWEGPITVGLSMTHHSAQPSEEKPLQR